MTRKVPHLMLLMLLASGAGCAAQRYSLPSLSAIRPSWWSSSTPAAPPVEPQQLSPPTSSPSHPPYVLQEDYYAPHPELEIPYPPTGASYEAPAAQPVNPEQGSLKKAARPPVLLQPINLKLGPNEKLISLEPPAVR